MKAAMQGVAVQLAGSAGCGDVRVWSAVGRGDQVMCIVLGPPAGAALLEVPVHGVKAFLENTKALVPRGAESGHIDWDLELANLLAKGWEKPSGRRAAGDLCPGGR
ncbi:SsgA family sporulation/cell division regulator [Streptomyces sp. NPDC056656]|uniref:SsgA family sporulation/cell division regulator n=1 Tax=Streptomyces sp. NPDC056656 TaxID=3345895 RepID=UPI00367AE78E